MSVYGKEIQDNGGNFVKWETVGQEFDGIFLRIGQGVNKREPSKPLFHGVFRKLDTGAEISVNAPSELLRKLQQVTPGDRLHITYMGQVPSPRGGFPKKTFRVLPVLPDNATVPGQAPVTYQQPQAAPPVPAPPPMPQAAPVDPRASDDPTTVAGLTTRLLRYESPANVALMTKMVANQPAEEQVRMLRETLVRNYGEKL